MHPNRPSSACPDGNLLPCQPDGAHVSFLPQLFGEELGGDTFHCIEIMCKVSGGVCEWEARGQAA